MWKEAQTKLNRLVSWVLSINEVEVGLLGVFSLADGYTKVDVFPFLRSLIEGRSSAFGSLLGSECIVLQVPLESRRGLPSGNNAVIPENDRGYIKVGADISDQAWLVIPLGDARISITTHL
ncbi:hypothetical protein HG530_008559 [Fusarium avenaceum]|nr:hypothetical protein HG530_008559 [Fusarium avenaceum]